MTHISRRDFLKLGAGAGALFAAPWSILEAHAVAKAPKLSAFVQPLPVPGNGIVVATPSAPGTYTFTQKAIARQLHPSLPATPLWAYDDGSGLAGQAGSFGMAVVARTGVPLSMNFVNALPAFYPPWIPVDPAIAVGGLGVRTMTHLHGGFVAAASDGSPAGGSAMGFGAGETQSVVYPNQGPQQPASLLWFHDHAMGATRLNVFAGLAAAYLIRDDFDTGDATNVNGLPSGKYEVPLVIQDRSFNVDGTMLYPVSPIPGVTWIGEYFGDTMLVNGKVWPFLDVEPRLYRFRILNGCNARILTLDFGGAPVVQIGAEGGLFDVPVPMQQLVLAPAERADVLVNFAGFKKKAIELKNHQLAKPMANPAPALASVMQFRVSGAATSTVGNAIPATIQGGRAANLPAASATRFYTLNEFGVDTPQWVLTLNGQRFDAMATSDTRAAGTIEDWTYINLTADTHPMHVHLVNFQVVGRTPFNAAAYAAANPGAIGSPGVDPTPFITGPMVPASPEERGFKDTVKANPGELTTIRMKFELPAGVTGEQRYVQHCHIVEHEDNDMMQAFSVTG
jgi:spore coat protein A, manganese oxidase